MSRLDLARERITDVGNPEFGHDMGEIWAAIKDDTSHPAWDIVSWDAGRYLSLVSGLHEIYGPQMSDDEYHALPESEQDAMAEHEERVARVAQDIGREVIDDLNLYAYVHWQETHVVDEAVNAGLHAAYRLAKDLMPESLEV